MVITKNNHFLATDDETNMTELETNVRKIEIDGLVWGASKMVPVGFGIKMLQINLVIEDEKVSLDMLQEKIEEDEDHVQSTDVVGFCFSFSQENRDANVMRSGCYAKVVGIASFMLRRIMKNENMFVVDCCMARIKK